MFNIPHFWVYFTEVLMAVSGGAGYWFGKRGPSGVVADVEALKTKVSEIDGALKNAPVQSGS